MKYNPLPKGLYIASSPIHGQGLFTSSPIAQKVNLGITHHQKDTEPDGYIRTPLGGFINHSEEPNAQITCTTEYCDLTTIKPIQPNEEITVTYGVVKKDWK